jgi:guanylate kinase
VPELALAVSATTRAQRPGEVDGRDYYFISRDEFDRRLANDEFLEWVEWPWGEHKRAGTLWSEVERITGEGRPVLLELETGGALAVKERLPSSISFFITAPSEAELERRLRARGTESEGEIEQRLESALEQRKLAPEFTNTIVNDDLDRAIGELEGLVRAELAAAGTMPAP